MNDGRKEQGSLCPSLRVLQPPAQARPRLLPTFIFITAWSMKMKGASTFVLLMLTAAAPCAAQDTCAAEIIPIPDALDSWQWVSGSYGPGGSITYELPLLQSNGINYEFKTGCGDGATADHNTVIEYRTPPPCILVNAESGNCTQGGARLYINFVVYAGPSRIRVSGANGEGGTFTMAYRSIGGMPGNCNECPSYDETLVPGSYWQTKDWTYGEGGCQVYRLQVQQGLTYEFKTGCGDGATADHNTRIALSNYACIEWAGDDDGCESGRSHLTWTAAWNGWAYVRVSGANNEAGGFTMAYRRSGGNGSTCGPCTQYDANLPAGWDWTMVSGSYLPGGCQIYRLYPDSGYVYTVKTGCGNGADTDHDARLELFDPSCNLLMTGSDACSDGSSTLEIPGTGQGWVYLRVSGNDGAAGSYTLATRKKGTCRNCPDFDAEIDPTTNWQDLEDGFLAYGCRTYKMNVEQGRTYFVRSECLDCDWWSAATMQLEAMDQYCEPIGVYPTMLNGFGQILNFQASFTGSLYLRISNTSWQSHNFTLAYQLIAPAADLCADAPVVPIALEAPVGLSGNLAGTTANDFPANTPWAGMAAAWYALDVSDHCYNLMVSYCGQTPAWPNTLGILATSCAMDSVLYGMPSYYFSCVDGNANYEYNVAPGTYYLPILFDPANPGDGSYTITLGCTNIIIDDIPSRDEKAVWQVHPNPGRDGFLLTGGTGPVEIQVMDPMGRDIFRSMVNGASSFVRTSGWTSGLYLIRIMYSGGASTVRWIKE